MQKMEISLLAFGAALLAGSIALTAARYGRLPTRVPIHFGITGVADSFGPRPLIWLTPAVQILFAAMASIRYFIGRDLRTLIAGIGLSAILFWVQIQILSAAISRTNRLRVAMFWVSVAVILAAMVVAVQRFR
jgi:4-hydroxybenzoate polyprenyltransferase